MRDPARIPVVIEALRAYWLAHPDMRLGQIIANAVHSNVFYIEDGNLKDAVNKMWEWD